MMEKHNILIEERDFFEEDSNFDFFKFKVFFIFNLCLFLRTFFLCKKISNLCLSLGAFAVLELVRIEDLFYVVA
jgi:hypothetical protein